MTDFYDHSYSNLKVDTETPDTPYEHKVCNITLFCSVAFVLAAAYYFFGPNDDGFRHTLMLFSGGIFVFALVNFMVAAFMGKLCGCKKP